MPKLYYPTPTELQGATPLNENLWMRQYQGLMLALANTKEGKDLLCIEDEGLPIIGMRKNVILYDQGDQLMADFRVGAKWGNVVRYRWQEIKRALDRMNELSLLKAMQVGVPAGAASLTQYPEPDPESTTCDGRTAGYGAPHLGGLSWADIRVDDDAAWSADSDNDHGEVLYMEGGPTAGTPLWVNLARTMILFNTSSLGAGSIVSATTVRMTALTLYGGGLAKREFFATDLSPEPAINIFVTTPASNTTLVNADHAQYETTAQCDSSISYTSMAASGSTDTWTFNATGRGNIVVDGISKFGVYDATYDASNTDPRTVNACTSSDSNRARYEAHRFYSDYTGTGSDPRLVVTYTLPTTAAVTGEIGDGATEQAVRSAT